jgi:hypothetical protein
MNTPIQWLFLDLNAFFASCEQQENLALRGKPIIVQTLTDSACAIGRQLSGQAPRHHHRQSIGPRAQIRGRLT